MIKCPQENVLHAYIDAHSQILTDEYPGDGVQDITILQSQFSNKTVASQNQIKYTILASTQNLWSEINYIKISQNSKALEI